MVVPFPAGGALDVVARALADEMRKHLGQPVVVENRAGAGGTLGSSHVARAAADGHTILFGSVATHAIASGLYSKLSYDALKDFTPVMQVTSSPLLVTGTLKLNATTLAELIAAAKAQPGKLNYGSTGNGTAVHLAAEVLKAGTGMDVLHVPYKGGPDAIQALITGDTAFMVTNLELALPQVRGGKLRALAVTGSRRIAALPDVPTLREAGVAGTEVTTWFGLFAPAGTPKAVAERLQRDAATALQDLAKRGVVQADEAVGSTPEQFTAFVQAEHAKWGKVIKDLGLKLD
jgi:tripartite-type tricarboxylate transporter receptor subunit TctC